MVDRGSTFIDAFIFVLKDIHIDGWDWWMGAAWNGGLLFFLAILLLVVRGRK